jgi:hypothetical protein
MKNAEKQIEAVAPLPMSAPRFLSASGAFLSRIKEDFYAASQALAFLRTGRLFSMGCSVISPGGSAGQRAVERV